MAVEKGSHLSLRVQTHTASRMSLRLIASRDHDKADLKNGRKS